MPTGDPIDVFGIGNGSFQDRVAENTWKHAAESNKAKWDAAEQRCAQANIELGMYKSLEDQLDPFAAVALTGGGIRRRRTMEESLRHLAELFASKYPKEDDEVVQNLINLFINPVEQKLQGDSDASDAAPESK